MKLRWNDYLDCNATRLMGILNVTPDSFSDGGLFVNLEDAITQAQRMIQEGADILDIGGQSTRPGSIPITPKDELHRVLPILEYLVRETTIPISIDTFCPEVADVCLSAGAAILNDVCGLRDPAMRRVAAKHGKPVVLMHMLGNPQTMQQSISYGDVINDLKNFFGRRIREVEDDGIQEIMIDPGIGFGKTAEHNIEIFHRLQEFKLLGYPLLIGASRKSFIGSITGRPVDDRVDGTIAACVIASMKGVDVVRVHDVKPVKRALQVADAIQRVKS
ncbi:MAG: dihydropteroate synthase [Solibacterales bacterium]|nr:dihydropteroate synthase [Bryobacterales bacterium]|tara:strand:+ start:858 stop:1682 length:825 start_codon:yes stop_codon:yes gene_type:complete